MIQPAIGTSIIKPFAGRFVCFGCRMIGVGDTMQEAYDSWWRMVHFNVEKRS